MLFRRRVFASAFARVGCREEARSQILLTFQPHTATRLHSYSKMPPRRPHPDDGEQEGPARQRIKSASGAPISVTPTPAGQAELQAKIAAARAKAAAMAATLTAGRSAAPPTAARPPPPVVAAPKSASEDIAARIAAAKAKISSLGGAPAPASSVSRNMRDIFRPVPDVLTLTGAATSPGERREADWDSPSAHAAAEQDGSAIGWEKGANEANGPDLLYCPSQCIGSGDIKEALAHV